MEKIFFILLALAGLIVLIALVLTIVKRKELLFWLPFTIAFIPIEYIDRYFFKLPIIVNWIPQLVLVLCLFLSLVIYLKRPLKTTPWFGYSYLLFILILIVSATINGTKIATVLYSQRGFIFIFGYLMTFKAIYESISLDGLYKITIKAGVISAVLSIIQRLFVTVANASGDMVTGLFSSDSQYLFFHCFCFVISIAYWYNKKKIIKKISPRNLSLLFILSIGIANNKAGIGFLILIILFFGLFVGYKNFWKFFGNMIILGIFISFSLMIFEKILIGSGRLSNEDNSFAYLMDPEYITSYMFGSDDLRQGEFSKSGTLRRGSAITFGYNLLKENPYYLFFGKGPGSTSESSVGEGFLSNQFEGYKIGRTTLSEKLTEVGLIGTFAFLFMILVIFFSKSKQYPLEDVHILIKKVSVLLIISYLPYENMFLTIINGLIISILLYPNLLNISDEKIFPEAEEKELELID